MNNQEHAVNQVQAGQLWQDVDGNARVCGVVPVEGVEYAVMLRTRGASRQRKRRPFLFPVASMLAGDDDWQYVHEVRASSQDERRAA